MIPGNVIIWIQTHLVFKMFMIVLVMIIKLEENNSRTIMCRIEVYSQIHILKIFSKDFLGRLYSLLLDFLKPAYKENKKLISAVAVNFQ